MPDSRPTFSVLPALRGGLIAALVALAAPVHAEEPASDARWVSDSLSTYVRSGPTDGHRIVGTLKSGQKLTLLGSQGNYSQVRGQNGDVVWILSNDLQAVPGQNERLPLLDAQVTELTGQLKTIDDYRTRVREFRRLAEARASVLDDKGWLNSAAPPVGAAGTERPYVRSFF